MRFIWSQLRTKDSQTTTALQNFPRFGNRKVKSPKREESVIAGCFSTPMITHWALRKSTSFLFYHLILFHKLHKPREGMRVWEATQAVLTYTDTEPNTKYFLLHCILTPRSIYWLKIQRGCFPGSNANLRLRKSRFNSLPHHILPVRPWAINISVPHPSVTETVFPYWRQCCKDKYLRKTSGITGHSHTCSGLLGNLSVCQYSQPGSRESQAKAANVKKIN